MGVGQGAEGELERIQDLLEEVLDLTGEARHRRLERARREDAEVWREVVSLLEHEAEEVPVLDGPLFSLTGGPAGLEAGQRVGAYQILEVIGEGGMGTVALARREHDFEKEVALKVLKPRGLPDGTVERFHNERQVLALLDHPNIAHILDGGTAENGRPFFVMEYVEGQSITRHCREQALSLEERLELFLRVCDAVETAHRSLVVHRDLKPSNILVTQEGVPKLLDFGIAKRLDAERAATDPGLGAPLTLLYASPEQVDPRPDRPITTATDIYSLGVILYELLTDRMPLPAADGGFATLVRAICEREPLPPSQVAEGRGRRRLTGDLDAIVGKALRKEPAARYGSVQQLADDIRRHLDARPVSARQGTWLYLLRRAARRHRGKLLAASFVLLAIFVGAVSSFLLWREAEAEQRRGEEVLVFLQGLFKQASPDSSRGEDLRALDVLERGEADVERLEDPLSQAKLLDTIADVYTSLGQHRRAEGPRRRAVDLLRRSHGGAHHDLAKSINDLASTLYRLKELDRAAALFREALEMKMTLDGAPWRWRKLSAAELDVAKTLSNLATIDLARQRYDDAEALYREALRQRIERFGDQDVDVAASLRNLANLLWVVGRYEEAEEAARRSVDIRRRVFGGAHTRTATALLTLARCLASQGKRDEAAQLYHEALEIRQERLGEQSPGAARVEVALADLHWQTGEAEEAAERAGRALANLDPDSASAAEARSVLGAVTVAEEKAEGCELLVTSHRQLVSLEGESSTRSRDAQLRLRPCLDPAAHHRRDPAQPDDGG